MSKIEPIGSNWHYNRWLTKEAVQAKLSELWESNAQLTELSIEYSESMPDGPEKDEKLASIQGAIRYQSNQITELEYVLSIF